MAPDQIIITGFILFFILINFMWSCSNISHGNKIEKLADEAVEHQEVGQA